MNNLKICRITFVILFTIFNSIGLYSQVVTPWFTTGDNSKLLQQQATLNFGTNSGTTNALVTVNTATSYQTMDGFGFCMTEGSAEVINILNSAQQSALLNELFDKTTGLGISVLRISIGASDLSSSDYSYDETSGDVNMVNFSLAGPDLNYLLPLLKKILLINSDIKILATPWSAPRWMKSNGSWIGGNLNTNCYAAYANYFVKYLDAMKSQGITIWGITPQNEPENPNNEPSMTMTSIEETNFINNNLGLAMSNAGYSNVKIIAYDHNCDDTVYPIYVCNNSSYVDGAAFHLYAGNISALSTVKNATNKNVYFTEQYTASTGNFSDDLGWHLQNVVIGSSNNWAKTIIEWNLATNTNFGPHTSGGCNTCLGAITVNSTTTYTRNVSYYIIGQISKFVQTEAIRIGCVNSSSSLFTSAFQNPNGTIALVTYNSSGSSQSVKVVSGNVSFISSIPGFSCATFVWSPVSNAILCLNNNQVLIYPNPGTSFVILKQTENKSKCKSVSFVSEDGKIALRQSVSDAGLEIKVDISKLPKGVYLIKMEGKASVSYSRFIKQ